MNYKTAASTTATTNGTALTSSSLASIPDSSHSDRDKACSYNSSTKALRLTKHQSTSTLSDVQSLYCQPLKYKEVLRILLQVRDCLTS